MASTIYARSGKIMVYSDAKAADSACCVCADCDYCQTNTVLNPLPVTFSGITSDIPFSGAYMCSGCSDFDGTYLLDYISPCYWYYTDTFECGYGETVHLTIEAELTEETIGTTDYGVWVVTVHLQATISGTTRDVYYYFKSAATFGPCVFSDSTSGISGDVAWSNPSYAYYNDNFYTQATLASGNTSEYLQVYDVPNSTSSYVFPTNVEVSGVTVTVERKATYADVISDYGVYLRYGSGGDPRIGNNLANPGYWGTSDTVVTYGAEDDDWGATLTPTILNDTTFGVCFAADNDGGSTRTAAVDYIFISVSWGYNTPTPIDCSDTYDLARHSWSHTTDDIYCNWLDATCQIN